MSDINHIQEFRVKTYVRGARVEESDIRSAIRHYVNDTAEMDLTELERVKVEEVRSDHVRSNYPLGGMERP